MIRRLRKLPKERLDGPALLRSVGGHDAIAFRALDLDGPERRGDAVEPELPAARRPQVPHPLRLAPARHEVAYPVILERAAEWHTPRLARVPTRHEEHQRPPEPLHNRVHKMGHYEPRTNIPRGFRVHESSPL